VVKVSAWTLYADAVRQQRIDMGIIERAEWGEWKTGDVVGIAREAGHFRFISVRVDTEGNPLHANVYGGIKGSEAFRSFDVDRLQTNAAKRNRRKKVVA
jgi:hypothetical protein